MESVFITVERPRGNDPGRAEEGFYKIIGNTVVLVDRAGNPLTNVDKRYEQKFSPGEDAVVARSDLRGPVWPRACAGRVLITSPARRAAVSPQSLVAHFLSLRRALRFHPASDDDGQACVMRSARSLVPISAVSFTSLTAEGLVTADVSAPGLPIKRAAQVRGSAWCCE